MFIKQCNYICITAAQAKQNYAIHVVTTKILVKYFTCYDKNFRKTTNIL